MDRRKTADYVAAIHNGGYMVRYYERGARLSLQRVQRQQAIQKLGLIVREAFAQCDDFEPLLAAVVDSLRPGNLQPF